MKRVHWTSTPEGRAKLSRIGRKGWRTRRAKAKIATPPKPTKESRHASAPEDFQAAYAYGYVQCWLAVYADSSGLSRPALARRVGGLLQVDAGRAPLRSPNRV